jgi:chorismate synthase
VLRLPSAGGAAEVVTFALLMGMGDGLMTLLRAARLAAALAALAALAAVRGAAGLREAAAGDGSAISGRWNPGRRCRRFNADVIRL